MLRSALNSVVYRLSEIKPELKKLGHMADRIQSMNQTMSKTSPKLFSIFMMLTTLPSFYFGHKAITAQYNQAQFTASASAGLTYINIKNMIFFFCLTALTKLKFNSPSAKHTVPKIGLVGSVLPPFLTFICLCLPPSDSKYSVLPTFAADFSTVIIEAQVANFGTYPFWLYSYRHFIRFFDWIILVSTFFAYYRLEKRIKSHPHEFTSTESKNSEENKEKSSLL